MLDHRYSGQDAQLKILLVLSELHGLEGIITWTPPCCYACVKCFVVFFKKEGFNPWWKGGIWSYVLHIKGIWEVFKGDSYNNQNSKSPTELNHEFFLESRSGWYFLLRFEDNLTDDADDIHKALKIHGSKIGAAPPTEISGCSRFLPSCFVEGWHVWLVVFTGSYWKNMFFGRYDWWKRTGNHMSCTRFPINATAEVSTLLTLFVENGLFVM